MSRPFASSARALTSTSKAVSVPRRAMRLARRSSLCAALFITTKSSLRMGRLLLQVISDFEGLGERYLKISDYGDGGSGRQGSEARRVSGNETANQLKQ